MPNSSTPWHSDRASKPIDEVYPVGSVWRHPSMPHLDVTVLSTEGSRVQVDWVGRDAGLNSDWPRGALDLASTVLVSLPDPTAKEAPMTTSYDPDRPYVVGDRVQVTDVRTTVGAYPLGSGESEFVGKTATIEGADYHDSYFLKFDDDTIQSFGTWSHAALDLIVDTSVTEIKVGDTVRVLAAMYGDYGIDKVGTVTSVTGTFTAAGAAEVHPYDVDLGSKGILHCIKVEKVDTTDDGLDPDNLTGMDLGDSEVAGPVDVNPDRVLEVGDRVRFRKTSWISGGDSADVGTMWDIVAGDEGVVTKVYPGIHGPATNIDIEWDKPGSRNAQGTHLSWVTPIDPPVPARPQIDFSGLRYATTREYAETLKSGALSDRANDVLTQIAAGQKVDAYDLNGQMPYVLSSCATRSRSSSERRELAKQARHLCHIVQAVLENHADDLPAYAEGERSRAVAAVKAEATGYALQVDAKQRELDAVSTALREQQQSNEDLRNERGTLTQAASDERRRLTDEIDALKTEASVRDLALARTQGALDYAVAMLPNSAEIKVAGFIDGFSRAHA